MRLANTGLNRTVARFSRHCRLGPKRWASREAINGQAETI